MSITALRTALIVLLRPTRIRSFGMIRCILASKLIVASQGRLSMWWREIASGLLITLLDGGDRYVYRLEYARFINVHVWSSIRSGAASPLCPSLPQRVNGPAVCFVERNELCLWHT
jgi:hypothetical protein